VRLRGELDPGARAERAVRIAPRAEPLSAAPRNLLARLARPAPLLGGALLVAGLAVALGPGGAPDTRGSVLVAARSLPAGTLLRAADLRAAGIDAGGGLLATLVPAAQEPRALGEMLSAPLVAGEPLAGLLLAGPGTPAAFTLTVLAEHALGGALLPGQRISVLATFQTAAGGAVTRLLARGLLVLAVGQPPSIGDPSQATIPVTVALPDRSLASRLALANSVGRIDLLRDGAANTAPIPPAASPAAGA